MSKQKPFVVPDPVHSSSSKKSVEPGTQRERRPGSITAEMLRRARMTIPKGEFYVDAEALRQVRAATPGGELHSLSLRSSGGCLPSILGNRCFYCGQRHLPKACTKPVTLLL